MDATTEAPDTYYAATALPRGKRPHLGHDVDTGVCVIGGGFAGLWVARALLERNYDVVVLEAGRVAGGASGRNGGFVSAGYAQDLDALIRRVGLDDARALYRLSRDGVAMVSSMLVASKRELDAVPGRLNVLRYDDEAALRREADMLADKFDHDMVVWPAERVRETLKTDRYFQALHDADAFHLNPLNLALALADDIENRGGRIYEMSAAIGADLDGVRKWVATSAGRVRAHHVVFCGSVSIGPAFAKLQRTVLPVATHVAVSAPLGRHLDEVIGYRGGISDTRRAFDYYRVLGDRLMWGGYISTRTTRPRGLAQRLQRDIVKIYPQLEGLHIDYAWTGIMGYAVHRMPQIGLLRPGVWIASAFGGQGLNTTAMAGDLIASAIAENDDRWRLFIPFGLVSAGRVVGRAMVQVMYWSAEVRDLYDERTAAWRNRWRTWRKERRAAAAVRRRERAKLAAANVVLRKAEKERRAAAREAERERLAAEREAEKARLAAEREAEKERRAAARRAEEERQASVQRAKEEAERIVTELRVRYDAAEVAEKEARERPKAVPRPAASPAPPGSRKKKKRPKAKKNSIDAEGGS